MKEQTPAAEQYESLKTIAPRTADACIVRDAINKDSVGFDLVVGVEFPAKLESEIQELTALCYGALYDLKDTDASKRRHLEWKARFKELTGLQT